MGSAIEFILSQVFLGSDLIHEYKYDVNGNVEYIGVAKTGFATSDPVWTVKKFTYDTSNNVVRDRVSVENSIMDDYLTLTYS